MARPALRDRRGFTLVELLVALVLTGIITGVMFQFLLDQTRFARYQTAREEVQQNARAAIELIASELRGIPPLGLEVAQQNSITFRAPRVWGVVCNFPSTTTIDVALPVAAGINYSVGSANTHPRVVGQAGTGLEEGVNRAWSGQKTVTAIAGPETACNGEALQAGTERRRFTVPDRTGFVVGNAAYLFDRVSFDTGTSNVPGNWIRRRVGSDAAPIQPLAGPIQALTGSAAGLRFRYFRADGTELTPPLSEANRNLVTRIEVTVETINSSRLDNAQSRLERLSVVLRNRP